MTGVWALLLDRPLSAQEAAELTALLPPERRERLHRMRLPEKRRDVLFLRYYLFFSDTEIGRLFGVCRSTIFRRRKRSLRFIRK